MDEHDKQVPRLPESRVPWWMDGKTLPDAEKEPRFFSAGLHRFWERLRHWLCYPLAQLDPMTCSEHLLGLLAWDRDITRFEQEPLALFRKRVKFAFVNAREAGETDGFINIFKRLGVGAVEIEERRPNRDWDIITIRLSDPQLSNNSALLAALIRQYGRTCRRYEYQVMSMTPLYFKASPMDWDHQCTAVTLEE